MFRESRCNKIDIKNIPRKWNQLSYAGVHYPIDNTEGIRLGRHIGKIFVNQLSKHYDTNQSQIDYPIIKSKNAPLPPPPYRQIIPFNGDEQCTSLTQDCKCIMED